LYVIRKDLGYLTVFYILFFIGVLFWAGSNDMESRSMMGFPNSPQLNPNYPPESKRNVEFDVAFVYPDSKNHSK
jgi:hypothetical protein